MCLAGIQGRAGIEAKFVEFPVICPGLLGGQADSLIPGWASQSDRPPLRAPFMLNSTFHTGCLIQKALHIIFLGNPS